MSATPAALSGPSLPPASGGPPKRIVVLLHGLGARGADVIGLAGLARAALPDAEFFAPDAPFPYDEAPNLRQWFSVRDRAPETLLAGAKAAAALLDPTLDAMLRARGLDESALALAGFSQGAMMALHAGLRRKTPVAGIVAFSGSFLGGAPGEIRARPPVLLIHGEKDPVVAFASMARAETALRAAGVPVEAMAREHLGHEVDAAGVEAAARFLSRSFAPRA